MNRFIQSIETFIAHTGRLASWLSLLIVLVTFTVVVMRYGFNSGSIALQESVMYLYAVLFMIGISYTFQCDGHVRVDIFYNRFSAKTRAWVNLLGILCLLLPMCGFIFYISWDFVVASWEYHETSGDAGGLEYVYLLKSMIPVMAVLLALQAVSQMLQNIRIILNRQENAISEHSVSNQV